MNTKLSGFAELPHTADWTLWVWADDLPTLFLQAARGMYSLLGLERGGGEPVSREIRLRANDLESLLVNFLSDLLFYLEEEGLAFDPVEVQIADTDLAARLAGVPAVGQRKEIKAVTYHRLAIEPTGSGYAVSITFDV